MQELESSRELCIFAVVEGIDIFEVTIQGVEKALNMSGRASSPMKSTRLTCHIGVAFQRCSSLCRFDELLQALVVDVGGRPLRYLVPGEILSELHDGNEGSVRVAFPWGDLKVTRQSLPPDNDSVDALQGAGRRTRDWD